MKPRPKIRVTRPERYDDSNLGIRQGYYFDGDTLEDCITKAGECRLFNDVEVLDIENFRSGEYLGPYRKADGQIKAIPKVTQC